MQTYYFHQNPVLFFGSSSSSFPPPPSPVASLSLRSAMKLPETHLDLVAAVAGEIAGVRCFRGRWSAISATLSDLRSALSSLSDLPNVSSNPISSDLLLSLSQTLTLTLNLAKDCTFPDPPAGKLRTQSDLDSAAAALSRLSADADLILKSGILLDSAAAATSSRRESARAEARSLVTRLQLGGAESRIAALDSLETLLKDDDKNVLIAAAQGAVPALIRLIDGHETREKAVALISTVSTVESCRHVVLAEGGALVNHLARVLESDAGSATEKACAAIQTLTLTRDNAVAFASRGGIASLLKICRSGTPAAQAAAAGVLKNLAGVHELRQSFLEETAAIQILIRVLSSGTVHAKENSVACLCNLAAGEDYNLKIEIFKEGGLDCLRDYWDGNRNLEPAIGLLRNLASLRQILEIVQSSELLPRVIAALDSSWAGTRTEAAKAVFKLANGGKSRMEFGEAVARLVRMLEAKGLEEKEAAVKALDSLMGFNGNKRLFRKEEKGILNVVMLLDPFVQNVELKYPVSVLLAVSPSKKCRRQMVALGTCGFLKRLVGMDVEGARRLLETLERGKLWGVFPRT